jgi:hypothetical protein
MAINIIKFTGKAITSCLLIVNWMSDKFTRKVKTSCVLIINWMSDKVIRQAKTSCWLIVNGMSDKFTGNAKTSCLLIVNWMSEKFTGNVKGNILFYRDNFRFDDVSNYVCSLFVYCWVYHPYNCDWCHHVWMNKNSMILIID